MRLRAVCLCLLVFATLVMLSSCGTTVPPQCLLCGQRQPQSFVYATTGAGKILIFPVGQSGALGAPSSVPGPAIVGGNITVSPSKELFVADHILNTFSALFENPSNLYSQATGSPYSLAPSAEASEGVTITPHGRFVYVVGLGGRD
jgi:hypothetical protein